MGAPGITPGGTTSVKGAYATTEFEILNPEDVKGSLGVFAKYPGATPKYALNNGTQRDNEYRETMARLFIQMTAQERRLFVNSCPPETRPLARVLAGVGTGASGGTGFVDFLLTTVQENFQEKVQIVESLSDNFVVYTFGQKAPIFTYAGVLLNTYQDDQRVWMMRLYQDVLRATQLARRKKLVRLRYDSVIVSGVLIAHGQALDAQMQTKADFSFQLVVTQYVIYTPAVGSPTALKTPFTEGGQYALTTAAIPSTDRLRVSRATHAGIAAKQPAAVEKAATNSSATRLINRDKKKQKELRDRTKKKTPPKENKDTRSGSGIIQSVGSGLERATSL